MELEYDVHARCKLFAYVRVTIPQGETLTVHSAGDDLGGGWVRNDSVPLVESGEVEMNYPGYPPYINTTFATYCQHDPQRRPGVRPAGDCLLRAITDVEYGCVIPKPGLKLDYQVLTAPGIFIPTGTPTYFIPVLGDMTVNGTPIFNKQIARRGTDEPVDVYPSEVAVAIWERS